MLIFAAFQAQIQIDVRKVTAKEESERMSIIANSRIKKKKKENSNSCAIFISLTRQPTNEND